jgi:hypothetical protein
MMACSLPAVTGLECLHWSSRMSGDSSWMFSAGILPVRLPFLRIPR